MSKKTVNIVDYGLGNLFSVERAVRYAGADAVISSEPGVISSSDYLIVPGVGAFGQGISNLKGRGLVEPIKSVASSGRPVLGICLGMQLLMTVGEEMGTHKGLDLISGKVVRFPAPADKGPHYKIPHIGWNGIYMPGHRKNWDSTILEGLKEGDSMYFVHSYVVAPDDPSHILAETAYGGLTFCSAINENNICGCQFHPEKSGALGLDIYRNFLKL
ncbi:MAG: imidazole glycerol phosphate synthase subunit HisH [Thermodesulfovibrionales bacterium]|nr:imidazole glycerol phosphate synthase subunit HisH [Thermodesulfovibrionales bacterium]